MVDLFEFGTAGMAITIIYIASGAFRLARFNIMDSDGYFTGLPITAAGTLLTLSYFGLSIFAPVFYMFFMLILAILMISTFTLKKV
jgi:CDP-diacylglycerol--serine O-phosphatidyltransferase